MTSSVQDKDAPITLVISNLDVGGASRVLTLLANTWAARGRPVTILALDWNRPSFFTMDPAVSVQHLDLIRSSTGLVSAVRNNWRRIVALRRAIRASRPGVVVSFMDRTNVVVLLAMIGSRLPVVVSDRTSQDPQSGWIWRTLRRLTYRRASAIVLQTQAMARDIHPELRRQVTVIPNPTPDDPGGSPDLEPAVTPTEGLVVALGRLVPQKGFDLLIEAFAIVAAARPDARLEIWGAGPEEARLASLISTSGLGFRAALAGQTDRAGDVLQQASVFVLSSRIEGFPNVLVEAMALGRPVVAVDCRYGPAEIVRDGIDGYLVPMNDPQALARAIVALLASPSDRETMGGRAREVRERFSLATVIDRWNALILAVSAPRGSR